MACLGVLDLFSGLYAGKMNPGLSDLKIYASKLMPATYSDLSLTLLYVCFRHKVAHLAHPYDVFDTNTARDRDNNKLITDKRRFVTWNVDFSDSVPAFTLHELGRQPLEGRAPAGWPVVYDHLARIHIQSLSNDIIESIRGPSGYLVELTKDRSKQQNFEKCMNVYFPTP